MDYRWSFHPEEPHLQEQLARSFSISRIAARLLVNRGIKNRDQAVDFLDPGLSSLSDPYTMSHMERAVERLAAALKRRETIVVYGDSDVDGVSGTALLTGFLRAVGGDVRAYIPNRLEEGYSLTERGLAFIAANKARVVVTVDNGTTAVERIAKLQADGVDVIVCDHHEPPETVPNAFALLNPKWSGCGYPFRYLCGTGVAFQLLSGLASRLPARGRNRDAMCDLIRHSIAFVAMATICDCVPLIGENRIFARTGLAALQETDHPGLRALLAIAEVSKEVQSDDISFRLGPRINAAGRLGQADQALALMLAETKDEAQLYARELDRKNGERQEIEATIVASAHRRVAEAGADHDPIIVLADPSWHAGIVGIVASRLAAAYNRPTVLIATRDGRGRGSGRSIGGFDLYAAFDACREHLVGFGGHAFAAGLEIEESRFDGFRRSLIQFAERHGPRENSPELRIDAEVPLGVLTPSLMYEINRLAPFGEGMASPIFVSPGIETDGPPRVVGKNQNHLTFVARQNDVRRKVIGYGLARHAERLRDGGAFSLAFIPRMTLFRGQANVELDLRDIRFREPTK